MKKFKALDKILRIWFVFATILLLFSFNNNSQEYIPIWFQEYGVEVRSIPQIGDTMHYNKSSKEDFKFVFYDSKGQCYCERYVNGKLFEKGYFENSLDTLKRYVSSRSSSGNNSPVRVQKYFQPIKNGVWKIYNNGKVSKTENYTMGGIQY